MKGMLLQDWRLIVDRTRPVVSSTTVLFEDKAEAVAAAAVAAVGQGMKGQAAATPQLAMELLLRLQQNGWLGKSQAIQVKPHDQLEVGYLKKLNKERDCNMLSA